MPSSSPYPSNWKEISLELKKKANWTCQKCGRKCIEPGQKVPEDWTVSKRMAYRTHLVSFFTNINFV